jgi:flagellar biosynthetic protein FlhB
MESTERIHPPTPHRRQFARQQGHVAKSHDVPLAGVFLAGVLLLMLGGTQLFGTLGDYLRQQWSGQSPLPADAGTAVEAGNAALLLLGRSLALICGALLAVAVVSHLLQTGFQPQPERLAPDFSRLDPLAAATRMFSGDTAARQLMLLLKLGILAGAAAWAVWGQRDRILALGSLAPATLAGGLADVMSGICLKIGGALLIVAAADYGFQRWRYERSLQMTPEEMREEIRSQNGDPALQRRRRQVQRELALAHLESSVVRAVEEPGLTQAISRQTAIGAPVAAEHYRTIAGLWQSPTSTSQRAEA